MLSGLILIPILHGQLRFLPFPVQTMGWKEPFFWAFAVNTSALVGGHAAVHFYDVIRSHNGANTNENHSRGAVIQL